MENKKGILGMDTAKSVFIMVLILAIIGVVAVLAVVSLRDAVEKADVQTVTLVNDTTTTVVNDSTTTLIDGDNTEVNRARNCAATVTSVWNNTGGVEELTTANYTVAGCTITFASVIAADADAYNNTLWNVSGSYTYSERDTNDMMLNLSAAYTDFFSNTGTIFAILVVIVIILAIAIVISVVSRFGGGGTGGGTSVGGGSSKQFGGDNITGI